MFNAVYMYNTKVQFLHPKVKINLIIFFFQSSADYRRY